MGYRTVPSRERLARLDRHLERAVRGLLAHDERVRGLDVRVDFAGGVAHLTGKVGAADRLTPLCALIGELAGVFAVWSRVRVAGVAPVLRATPPYPLLGADLNAAYVVPAAGFPEHMWRIGWSLIPRGGSLPGRPGQPHGRQWRGTSGVLPGPAAAPPPPPACRPGAPAWCSVRYPPARRP